MQVQKKKSFVTNVAVAILLAAVLLGATSYFVAAIFADGADVAYAEAETRYCDGYLGVSNYETQTETIYYATKNTTTNKIGNSFPNYYNTDSSVTDNCAAVAGTILMGYYDRYFSELIPGTATGSNRGFGFSYYSQNTIGTYVLSMMDTFYSLMNVGESGYGATRSDYISGLTSYVQSKGQSISFDSVMSGSSIDINKLDAAIEADEPVTIYMRGFGLATSISDNGSSAVYTIRNYATSAHIMIVYGYQKIDYYNAAGQLVSSKLNLMVSNGLNGVTGYVMAGMGSMDAADAVDVY